MKTLCLALALLGVALGLPVYNVHGHWKQVSPLAEYPVSGTISINQLVRTGTATFDGTVTISKQVLRLFIESEIKDTGTKTGYGRPKLVTKGNDILNLNSTCFMTIDLLNNDKDISYFVRLRASDGLDNEISLTSLP